MATTPVPMYSGQCVQSGVSNVATLPTSGIQDGDLLLIGVSAAIVGTPTWSGSILFGHVEASGQALTVLGKFLTTADNNTTKTVTAADSAKRPGVWIIVRGVDPEAYLDVDAATSLSAVASINRVLTAMTSTQPNDLRVAFAANHTGSSATQETHFAGTAGTSTAGLTRLQERFSSATGGATGIAVLTSGSTVFADGDSLPGSTITTVQSAPGETIHLALAPITTPAIIQPTADTNLGSYTVAVAASGTAALNNASDAQFIESPNNPTAEVSRFEATAVGTPASPNKFRLRPVRACLSGAASSHSLIVRLKEGGGTTLGGGTTRATRTITTLTTGWLDFDLALTRAEEASVTDWTDLYFEFVSTAAP